VTPRNDNKKTKMEEYQNISCSYYDQLEAYATQRTHCAVIYNDGEERSASGIIIDVYAQNGAEYLKLNNGTVIRLDHLISINGVPVSNVC
jgi:Rho-binding antiterminator